MEFEQFKRKMQTDQDIHQEKELGIEDLVYHKFLVGMVEAVREEKYKNFTINDYVENLNILQVRFGSFLDELMNYNTGGGQEAEAVKGRMMSALAGILDILEELKNLPEDPDNENFDRLLEEFRAWNQDILDVNREMESMAKENKLDLI